MSEKPTDDPCDVIDLKILDGWTRYDSSGMRKKNNGEGLGRDQGDRYQDSWLRNDNG